MKNVTTRDTGRDITQLLQIAADRHGFDPIGFATHLRNFREALDKSG